MKKITISILLFLSCCVGEKNVNFSQTNTSSSPVVTIQKIPYEVLKERCIEENKCFILAFVESQYFNKKDMMELANQLSEDFKDKKTVTVTLFDNKDLASSYIEGKKEVRELSFDARARYQRVGDKEFLIFSRKKKLGDLSNSEVIKIRKN